MKIYAIKDDNMSQDFILGYLIYYEISKTFYIELSDNLDPWYAPPLFFSFTERGQYSIDSYWSHIWVRQRIVPQDRQNIREILRDNGLKKYDEYDLLMLANGRCEQDDFFLEEYPANKLPDILIRRGTTKIEDILPLDVPRLLVFFRNGVSKVVDVQELHVPACEPHYVSQERFNKVEVQPDGYGVYWNEQAMLPHADLFTHGINVPFSLQDLHRFVENRIVSASEACHILDCSRQNIDDLMRRDRLHPIRTDAKYKLFSKTEVMQRRKPSE